MSQSLTGSRVPKTAPRTVADIVASLPRVTLPTDLSVELGERAYAMIAAGQSRANIEIELFATPDMIGRGISDYLTAQVAAGRTLPALTSTIGAVA